jgi:hypothetical protein
MASSAVVGTPAPKAGAARTRSQPRSGKARRPSLCSYLDAFNDAIVGTIHVVGEYRR